MNGYYLGLLIGIVIGILAGCIVVKIHRINEDASKKGKEKLDKEFWGW